MNLVKTTALALILSLNLAYAMMEEDAGGSSSKSVRTLATVQEEITDIIKPIGTVNKKLASIQNVLSSLGADFNVNEFDVGTLKLMIGAKQLDSIWDLLGITPLEQKGSKSPSPHLFTSDEPQSAPQTPPKDVSGTESFLEEESDDEQDLQGSPPLSSSGSKTPSEDEKDSESIPSSPLPSDEESEEDTLDQAETFQPAGPASNVESEKESDLLAPLSPNARQFITDLDLNLEEMKSPYDLIEGMVAKGQIRKGLLEQYLYPILDSIVDPLNTSLKDALLEMARHWALMTAQRAAYGQALSSSTGQLKEELAEKHYQQLALHTKQKQIKEEWEKASTHYQAALDTLKSKEAEYEAQYSEKRTTLDDRWKASIAQQATERDALSKEINQSYQKQRGFLSQQKSEYFANTEWRLLEQRLSELRAQLDEAIDPIEKQWEVSEIENDKAWKDLEQKKEEFTLNHATQQEALEREEPENSARRADLQEKFMAFHKQLNEDRTALNKERKEGLNFYQTKRASLEEPYIQALNQVQKEQDVLTEKRQKIWASLEETERNLSQKIEQIKSQQNKKEKELEDRYAQSQASYKEEMKELSKKEREAHDQFKREREVLAQERAQANSLYQQKWKATETELEEIQVHMKQISEKLKPLQDLVEIWQSGDTAPAA